MNLSVRIEGSAPYTAVHARPEPRLELVGQPLVSGVGSAFPEHCVTHEQVVDLLVGRGASRRVVERIAASTKATEVRTRRLVATPEWYRHAHGFDERVSVGCAAGVALAVRAAQSAMRSASCAPGDVTAVVFATSTVVAMPSPDLFVIDALGLDHSVMRVPIWGRGCAGGVAALGVAARLAAARPGSVLVVSVEVPSVHGRHDATSMNDVLSALLYADGAAAMVLSSAVTDDAVSEGPASCPAVARVLGSHSTLVPGSAGICGWQVDAQGFAYHHDSEYTRIGRREIPAAVRRAAAELGVDDLIGSGRLWAALPAAASPVLDMYASELRLHPEATRINLEVSAQIGDISSPSPLAALEHVLPAAPQGSTILMMAGARRLFRTAVAADVIRDPGSGLSAVRQDNPEAEVDVVVVGLGPTGATLSVLLAAQGCRVVALEASAAPGADGPVVGFTGAALRVWQQLGLAEEILASAEERPEGSDEDHRLGSRAHDAPGTADITTWGSCAFLRRSALLETIQRRSVQLGVDARWRTTVVGVSSRDDSVLVITVGTGGIGVIRARFVVGCDGKDSTVRSVFRVGFGPRPVAAGTVTQLGVAPRWWNDRVIIAGSAAHDCSLNRPFVDAGVRDAANLAWRLAAVCRSGLPMDLLGSCESERRSELCAATWSDPQPLRGTTPVEFPQWQLLSGVRTDELLGPGDAMVVAPNQWHRRSEFERTLRCRREGSPASPVRTSQTVDRVARRWMEDRGLAAVLVRPDRIVAAAIPVTGPDV